MKRLVLLLLPLVLFACDSNTDQPCTLSGSKDTLTIVDITVGTGATARCGDDLFVRYTGSLSSGAVFDSGEFEFTLGYGVIPGFSLGVDGMREGGKRRITIPPALGYGNEGVPRGCTGNNCSIPPNSTIVFEVDLIRVTR